MNLNLATQRLVDGLAVEASAGTGKTYSISALLARELVADERMGIGNVLVTTFTRNAAAELRDRIRGMLVACESSLRSLEPPDDPFLLSLRQLAEPADGAERLRRALAAFDSANIMTIHQFCSIILRAASQSVDLGAEEVPIRRTISMAVNDELVTLMGTADGSDSARGILQRTANPTLLADVVEAALAHHGAALVLASGIDGIPDDLRSGVAGELRTFVNACCARVQAALASTPSFDELIRRAHDVLCSGQHGAVREALAARFQWVLVDEAQDTDSLQWEILGSVFSRVDGGHPRGSISIGDPKQAIYGFRGADVNAYLRHVKHVDTSLRRTLTTNFRSDERLVEALNVLLDGARFGGVPDGPSIVFEQVVARQEHPAIVGVEGMCVLDLVGATNQDDLVAPVADRVVELLSSGVTISDGSGTTRPLRPRDITVLTRTGRTAQDVQRKLLKHGIPAVSNSTQSVAAGSTYGAIRRLARAIARPSHDGLTRMLAVSEFFGWSMLDPHLQDEGFLAEMQDLLESLRRTLASDGVTALAEAVLRSGVPRSDSTVSDTFLASQDGLRRLTDFSHVIEYVHSATRGRGIQPEELISHLDDLRLVDEKSDVAARRVETDEDAVQTMTIHSSKGLEFPVVIVADLWKPLTVKRSKPTVTVVEWEGGDEIDPGRRVIDMGHVFGGKLAPDEDGSRTMVGELDRIRKKSAFDERSRLFYVAVTRAKHHLTVAIPVPAPDAVFREGEGEVAIRTGDRGCLDLARLTELRGTVVRRPGRDLPDPMDRPPGDDVPELTIAPSGRSVSVVHPRTSFTAITRAMSQQSSVAVDELPRVDDELVGEASQSAEVDPQGMVELPLWPLPAGRHFGIAVHAILEHVPTDADLPLQERVRESVLRYASPRLISRHGDLLVDGLCRVLETPLGESWEDVRLCDLEPSQRVNEMRFNAGLSESSVPVAVLGEHLTGVLAVDDPLRAYAVDLASLAPQVDVRGVLNGSIDTMLWLPVRGEDRLVICDYKSNRISQPDHLAPIDRYSPLRLRDEMAHHHYPLQALLYGVAAFRYLRWRTGDAVRADRMVGGYAYLFVRGMVGAGTPADSNGRYGVASWSSDPYPGLWSELSGLLAGVRQ